MTMPPVEFMPGDAPNDRPAEGLALCLSGGGYRAMVFHVGALWRLYETGYLRRIVRISSVSGGSITAAVLALKWPKLNFDSFAAGDFVREIVVPIRSMASETIDEEAILLGLTLPG